MPRLVDRPRILRLVDEGWLTGPQSVGYQDTSKAVGSRALERAAAERMGAKTTEVASSHVPMLSHPDLVLDVIREAASSF